MIEHFKKFDTDKKKLLPLSFSHLNEFAFNRERWALRRIFGYEFPTSASAERGTAVETALNMIMTGSDYEVAKAKMISIYNTIHGTNYQTHTNCGSCLSTCFDGIKKLYEKYKND